MPESPRHGVRDGRLGFGHDLKDGARRPNHFGPFRGQHRRPPRAVEKLSTEFGFKGRDLLADRRSREVDHPCGSSEAAMLFDGEEGFELPGIHEHKVNYT